MEKSEGDPAAFSVFFQVCIISLFKAGIHDRPYVFRETFRAIYNNRELLELSQRFEIKKFHRLKFIIRADDESNDFPFLAIQDAVQSISYDISNYSRNIFYKFT